MLGCQWGSPALSFFIGAFPLTLGAAGGRFWSGIGITFTTCLSQLRSWNQKHALLVLTWFFSSFFYWRIVELFWSWVGFLENVKIGCEINMRYVRLSVLWQMLRCWHIAVDGFSFDLNDVNILIAWHWACLSFIGLFCFWNYFGGGVDLLEFHCILDVVINCNTCYKPVIKPSPFISLFLICCLHLPSDHGSFNSAS